MTARALILIGGTDNWHDLYGAAATFQRTLTDAYVAASVGVGLGRFERPTSAVTRDADVYVLYTMGHRMTPGDQAALAAAVEQGKGLVVLHASNVLTHEMGPAEEHAAYFNLIGSRFTTHDAFASLTVRPAAGEEHPVTAGVGEFRVEDEPYQFEWAGPPSRVLAVRDPSGGESAGEYPVVYVREPGAGRVCYIALGHDARAWAHPSFRRLLVQAVRWAGGGAGS